MARASAERADRSDEDSSSSSSDSEFSASSSSSSSSVSSEVEATENSFGVGGGGGQAVSVRRRMAPASGNGYRSDDDNNNNNSNNNIQIQPSYSHEKKHRRHHHHHHNQHHHHNHRHRHDWTRPCVTMQRTWRTIKRHRRTILRHLPTLLVIFCFVFWLIVQTGNVYDSVKQSTHQQREQRLQRRKAKIRHYRGEAPPPPSLPPKSTLASAGSFLSDAFDGFMDIVKLPVRAFRHVSRGEALPPGCVRSEWQELNLPNCNEIHATDLFEAFVHSDRGYVGAGYWRHVWLVQQSTGKSSSSTAVLKMMKQEHKLDSRNFERHRRDALAMERLTSAPNIVDIYGYCGNSVLTEYVGSDLHKYLFHADDDEYAPLADKRLKAQKPRRSDRDMLQLALGVAKGVAALHELPGGPIVHADVADKQFLIDERGIVKLNDFNRCRFMGHYKDKPNDKCTFRIPSAPGRHRSPEEYDDDELTEQLDTYSMANVLYGVLTGVSPWDSLPSSQVKKAVQKGLKPPIGLALRQPGTATSLLADLVDQAYEHDPKVRITAPAMVVELEKALAELPQQQQEKSSQK